MFIPWEYSTFQVESQGVHVEYIPSNVEIWVDATIGIIPLGIGGGE